MPGYVPDYSSEMDQDPSAINVSDPYAAMRRRIAAQAIGGNASSGGTALSDGADPSQAGAPIDITDRAAMKRMPVRIGTGDFASRLDPRVRQQIADEVLNDPSFSKAPMTGTFNGKSYTMDTAPSISQDAAQAMNQRILEAARLRAASENAAGQRNFTLEQERRKQLHDDMLQQQQWAHEKELFERANPYQLREDQVALAHTNAVNAQNEANFKAAHGGMSQADLQQARMNAINGLIPQLAGKGQAGAAAAAGLYKDLPGFDQPGIQQALSTIATQSPLEQASRTQALLQHPALSGDLQDLKNRVSSAYGGWWGQAGLPQFTKQSTLDAISPEVQKLVEKAQQLDPQTDPKIIQQAIISELTRGTPNTTTGEAVRHAVSFLPSSAQ